MENTMGRNDRLLVMITSFVYLAMIATCIGGLVHRGPDNLPSIYVMNVSIETFAILVGYILFISCIIDVQKSGADLQWFIYMLNVAIWWAFTDAC